MDDIREKINQNYFDLTAELIRSALVPCSSKGSDNEKETNRTFANSRIIDLFCDVTDNFEASKLRKIILDKNK